MIPTFVTAWVLVFSPNMSAVDTKIVVPAIANFTACMQLGKDMRGGLAKPYYACFEYPIVTGGQTLSEARGRY